MEVRQVYNKIGYYKRIGKLDEANILKEELKKARFNKIKDSIQIITNGAPIEDKPIIINNPFVENKQDTKTGYIYKIVSESTDNIYIGSTIYSINKRFKGHLYDYKKRNDIIELKEGEGMSSYSIIKYGNAKVELIEEVKYNDIKELHIREADHIMINKDKVINKQLPCKLHNKPKFKPKNKKVMIPQSDRPEGDRLLVIPEITVVKSPKQNNKQDDKQDMINYLKEVIRKETDLNKQ
jgi:hypothetical protein